MDRTAQRWTAGGVVALLFVSYVALAQVAESLRGTIESVDGQSLVVNARTGTTINVRLADDAHVFILKPAALADAKVGSFVGMTTQPQPGGTESVVELYIFPSDPSRDPFNIPTSGLFSPRNEADVLNYVEGSILKNDGQTLTLRGSMADEMVPVSADINVVAVTPTTSADILAGQKVFVPNGKPVDFGLIAPTVILGE
jgi:hypothetical protein